MTEYSRRHVCTLTLRSFASIALALPSITLAADRSLDLEMNWATFLQRLDDEAARQRLAHWNQETLCQSRRAVTCPAGPSQLEHSGSTPQSLKGVSNHG